ncbi:MAG: GDSL-type esterase/lipase family protein, partial [Akkermansia sp.]
MKLHLNLSLRAALMACYALAAPLATTLLSASLLLIPQTQAADSDDIAATIVAATQEADAATSYDLGNVMFVGDSITHGGNCQSYRWNIHTILVDNGLTYNSIGIMQGDWSAEQSPNSYGGVTYTNIHNSESGGTAAAISGSGDDSRNKFGDSNIKNWMGQSTTTADGTDYILGASMDCDSPADIDATLKVFDDHYVLEDESLAEYVQGSPDVFWMMIGTNDVSNDWNTWDGSEPVTDVDDIARLYADMETIYASVRENNADCKIILGTLPVWEATYSWAGVNDTGRQAIYAYNQSLFEWATAKNDDNLVIVDTSVGMVDVTLGVENYKGVTSMYYDKLHPSDQGNLIYAANFAKGSGYAGGTAGQLRKSETTFRTNFFTSSGSTDFVDAAHVEAAGIQLSNASVTATTIQLGGNGQTSSLFYAWQDGEGLDNGATLDFNLTFGDGATGGWNTTDDLDIIMGNNAYVGMLSIDEGYISWGDSILYSMDTSENEYNFRLAWVNGEASSQLESGFYLWLDDMLIGKGLQGGSGSFAEYNGVTFIYDGSGKVILNELSIDGTASYAPTTDGLTNEDGAYIATADDPSGPSASTISWNDDGSVVWTSQDFDADHQGSGTASGSDYYARGVLTSATSGDVSLTIDCGTATRIYASSGSHTGNIWAEVTTGAIAKNSISWYAAHGCGSSTTGASMIVDGSVFLKFTGDATGSQVDANGNLSGNGASVLGAINGGKVTGSIYLEFSAENLHLGNGYSNFGASVAGAYNSNVTGDMRMVFNAGTFESAIYGGVIGNVASSIGGTSYIDVNGGTFNGAIYGGGKIGSQGGNVANIASALTTSVDIRAGQINASVYGGGTGGTISGNTSVKVSGGTITGDVYGGGSGGTITGNTSVTIDGSDVILHDGEAWGDINTGGASSIAGSQTLTIKNVSDSNTLHGFDQFAGNITSTNSSNSQINFENVQVSNFAATITNFNTMSIGANCDITFSSDAGITVDRLVLDSNLSLTIAENSSLTITSLGSVFVSFESCSITNKGTFSFTDDTLINPAALGGLISGDGTINMAGTWDVSSLLANADVLADFDANNLVLGDGLQLNLGSGLDDGTYALFGAASVTGIDAAISVAGLADNQEFKLYFNEVSKDLELIISTIPTLTWDDGSDNFSSGDASSSILVVDASAASMNVVLSEDTEGRRLSLAGEQGITISGADLSATEGISIAASTVSLADGGSLSGQMSFEKAATLDAGAIDITATTATTIDGSVGFNSLSGTLVDADVDVTGKASMNDVDLTESSLSIGAGASLSLAGSSSLANVTAAGSFFGQGSTLSLAGGAQVTINGEAISYKKTDGSVNINTNYTIDLGEGSKLSQNTQLWLSAPSLTTTQDVVIKGTGTYELTSLLMRYTRDGKDVNLSIENGATMHTTNTYTSAASYNTGFVMSGADATGKSYVKVAGKLIIDSGITTYGDGHGELSVEKGGTLVLNRGTLSAQRLDGTITLNVEDGGKLELGNTINDSYTEASASDDLSQMTLNLKAGSTLYGTGTSFSADGFVSTTTTNVYQSLSLVESGTVNMGTAKGSTMNIYSALNQGENAVTLNVTGGSLNLAAGATLTGITAASGSSLALGGGVSAVGRVDLQGASMSLSADSTLKADVKMSEGSLLTASSYSVSAGAAGASITMGESGSMTGSSMLNARIDGAKLSIASAATLSLTNVSIGAGTSFSQAATAIVTRMAPDAASVALSGDNALSASVEGGTLAIDGNNYTISTFSDDLAVSID